VFVIPKIEVLKMEQGFSIVILFAMFLTFSISGTLLGEELSSCFFFTLVASLIALVSLLPLIGIVLQFLMSYFILVPLSKILLIADPLFIYFLLLAYLVLGFAFCGFNTYRFLPKIFSTR